MVRFKPIVLLIAGPLLMTSIFPGLPSRVHEFAQVADGGDANFWMRTSFFVRNQSLWEANITVKFFDDTGKPWAVTIGGNKASTHTAKIAPDGMVKLMTAGQGGTLKAGWATLTADKEVGAQLFFELFSEGELTTQAAVESVGSMRSVEVFVDMDTAIGQRTGLAVANLSDVGPVEVGIVLSDENGSNPRSGFFEIPAMGHVAKYIDELTGVKKYRGTALVKSNGAITVTALQQTGFIIGTLPPMRRTLNARFGGEQ